MIRRLLAATGVVAALLGATFAAPSLAAAAGNPTQVALVVDYPDGTTRPFCVDYRSGMSGADVLAVASPVYGSGPYAGFVLKIGGQGTVPPTTSKYWAYWTTVGGNLVYSSSGVTSTHPRAGTVEAWHWNSTAGAESPTGGSYASLCPGGFSAPAPAAPTTTAPAPGGGAAPAATNSGSAGGDPTAPGTGGDTTGSGTPAATTAATASPDATARAPSSPGASTSASTGRDTSSRAPTSVAASDVAAASRAGLGGGATIGLLVAAAAVVAFAVLAVVARRRRLDQD